MIQFSAATALLADAVRQHVTPAAVIEVGREGGPLWSQAFGTLTYATDSAPAREDTIFDLASLTKVIATTSLLMRAVDQGRLRLGDPIRSYLRLCRGADRDDVTVRDLAAHCSGMTAYLPFFRDYRGRAEFERAICTLALEYAPRTKSVYSDLGYMLLGFILEDVLGRKLPDLFADLATSIGIDAIRFSPPPTDRARTAPTEVDPWRGRLLVGEVHDENCWALDGAAGHSGLFGTAPAAGAFSRIVLNTFRRDTALGRRHTMHAFATRTTDVPGSSRAIGWDTMLPTSSCGTLMRPTAIGHTGFTGSSLWIDWERDLYIVLLTNRVHPSRENNALKGLRGRIHDAVVADLDK